MRLKKINLSIGETGKAAFLSWMLGVASFVVASFYGATGVGNPFTVLGVFFGIQMALIIFTSMYKDVSNSTLKLALTFGPLKLITIGVLIACTVPVQSFLLLIIPGAVVCLLAALVSDLSTIGRHLWEEYQDRRTFTNHMKEVAHTARIEDSLSSDLAAFLTGADSAGKEQY
jgi:hypothetical protein